MVKNTLKIGVTNDIGVARCRLLVKTIEFCGAIPVLIPRRLDEKTTKDKIPQALENHLLEVEKILQSCDALIFPGNRNDVHPSLYGDFDIHPETARRLSKDFLNVRQETEIFMIKYALKNQNIPILGICGGMHLINVALGGSLAQHLPDDVRNQKSEVHHYDDHLKESTTLSPEEFEENFFKILSGRKENDIYKESHSLKVFENSLLAEIYRKNGLKVDLNKIFELSIHHQGCFLENLAPDLQAVAIADDGVVEAAQHKTYPKMFLLTQFHPECNADLAKGLVRELMTYAL